MAAPYQQDLEFYRQPQWPADSKPTPCSEGDEMSLLDDKILDPTTPAELSADNDSRRHSLDHRTNSFQSRATMWHDPSQQVAFDHNRQQAHTSVPMIDTSRAQFSRMDMPHELAYAGHQSWPASAMSGTSTPTPVYDQSAQDYHSMPYSAGQMNFNSMAYGNASYSATPMSPQSSQGGWISATSSDGTESHSRTLGSPTFRAASPGSHMRRDGIRKKNARFDIPAERNLSNIDSLISQTADEQEKKELKQQKRLLRNRQAALDSRQRKKLHTEKLELEKKDFNQVMSDLQEENRQLKEAFQHQSELLQRQADTTMHQQQEYEHYIHNVTYERDEAIRAKTVETAELRKQNNILKDHIRDYERQPASGNNVHNIYPGQFSSFIEPDMESQGWEDDFSFINHSDYRKTIEQRGVTPTPAQASKGMMGEAKPDVPFSWNAFYMCLLFGAFIASNSGTNSKPSVPALSEEYRAESANVLKAVLASGPNDPHSLMPQAGAPIPSQFSSDPSHAIIQNAIPGSNTMPQDSLGALHASLTTPTRAQRETAAFSLSAASYDHLTNPDTFLSGSSAADGDVFESKPSQLQSAFNALQESRQDVDKVINRGVNERSIMWDRVPEKVLRDFRRMVEDTEMRH